MTQMAGCLTTFSEATPENSIEEKDVLENLAPVDLNLPFGEASNDYQLWCKSRHRTREFWLSMYEFIHGKDLVAVPYDPDHYPGLNHVTHMVTCGWKSFEDLSNREQGNIKRALTKALADGYVEGCFEVGQVVSNRWFVFKQLSVGGCFNRGVRLVYDICDPNQTTRVLKILPSEGMYPEYATREIQITRFLRGPANIIQFRDGMLPPQRHAAPWLVADFCDLGTLNDCIKQHVTSTGRGLPELFMWHVFESVLKALVHAHFGPAYGHNAWDAVSHRDIITSNILLATNVAPGALYPVVQLGDWGCAVSHSEYVARSLTPHDLPAVDNGAMPPEGSEPAQTTDVYQLGLIIVDLMGIGLKDASEWHKYSPDLQYYVNACIMQDPAQRPSLAMLLDSVRERKTDLLALGILKFEQLILD
jgi:serine/threonine protein kinase